MTFEPPDFNPENDDVLRICPLTTEIDEPSENSEKRVCADCGRDIWFNTAQSHGPVIDQYPTTCLCGECGLVRVLAQGAYVMNLPGHEPFEVKSLDEQMQEFLP